MISQNLFSFYIHIEIGIKLVRMTLDRLVYKS